MGLLLLCEAARGEPEALEPPGDTSRWLRTLRSFSVPGPTVLQSSRAIVNSSAIYRAKNKHAIRRDRLSSIAKGRR